MTRMEKFRTHFPSDDPSFGESMIDTAECIDGEYLEGSFDDYLFETGYSPEEIGVSKKAIAQREQETSFQQYKEQTQAIQPNGGNVSTQIVANVIDQLMRPLLESIGTLLKNNTEAMEQIAASQDVIRNRMEALEKQVRLQTPVTDRQARYIADAAREKARELLDKKGVDDKKAVTKLAGAIKKAVMARYGIGSLREVPRCEYTVAMSQIETWNSALTVLEIVKEARARAEENHAN